MVRRGTRVFQGILASLGPQDPQDLLDHRTMDRRESLVQRAPKDFLEPLDHLEKPVPRENLVFPLQSQGPRDLLGPQAVLAPKVHLVPRDPWENVIQVFLGLMVNQEFQELDSLDFLDLRETEVFQEQKDHRAVLEKWESQGYLEIQAFQESRENQHSPHLENQEHQVGREKEAILEKVEKWDSLDFLVSLECQELEGLMDHEGIQDSLDHLEKEDPQEGAQKVPGEPKDFQA